MNQYALWLHEVRGVSRRILFQLRELLGENDEFAEMIYRMPEYELGNLFRQIPDERGRNADTLQRLFDARKEKPEETATRLWEKEIGFVSFDDPEYPSKLKNIPDPPFGLYYLGRLPDELMPSLAVVGARMTTPYGRETARSYVQLLAEQGIQIISGMARGIDGIAGRAALESDGSTFAVLGGGVDICYPKENEDLYNQLIQYGGVISEYPPGMMPQARMFPARNRIISGLADALFVVEAREKSGTQITVSCALDQGRDIFALPGRVSDAASAGCNRMIRDGAMIASDPEDILQYFFGVENEDGNSEYGQMRIVWSGDGYDCADGNDTGMLKDAAARYGEGLASERKEGVRAHTLSKMSKVANAIYLALDASTPYSMETLKASVEQNLGRSVSSQEMIRELTMLCLKGLASQQGTGHYISI